MDVDAVAVVKEVGRVGLGAEIYVSGMLISTWLSNLSTAFKYQKVGISGRTMAQCIEDTNYFQRRSSGIARFPDIVPSRH